MSQQREKGYFDEYENLTFHPYNILLALSLFGITAMFLSMSLAFVYNRIQADLPPVRLPWLFIVNTLILLASSGTLIQAKRAFKQDDTSGYKKALYNTFLLSVLFLISQIVAWYLLFADEQYLGKNNSVSYLYIISALHFVHVIAGLPFLFLFHRAAILHMREPVSVLIYFADPAKRLKLRLLTIYWHFLDFLWIYLVLFFAINAIIH